MKGTRKNRKNKARNKKKAKDVAEKALLIAIENANLDARTIKALRLTCKRTKVAADAKVKTFKLDGNEDRDAIQISGLLKNITKLHIRFESTLDPQKLAGRGGLLKLAVDICSNSLEVLRVYIEAALEHCLTCANILGSVTWDSLRELTLVNDVQDFLSVVLQANRLPALKILNFHESPSAADLNSIHKSSFIGNLTDFSVRWGALPSNAATAAAMRGLLKKATSLKNLTLHSSTFDFFDSENLRSLESLELINPKGAINFAPVLARPWPKVQSLCIRGTGCETILQGADLVRIFEAEDTLPVLEKLKIYSCKFAVDVPMSCVRRPHLKEFQLGSSHNGHLLVSALAQAMKKDTQALPSLRDLQVSCVNERPRASAREAISEILSCPCMAALERLTVSGAWMKLGAKEAGLLSDIANYCPKLKLLDLRMNSLDRPVVALLLGYGKFMGAWPELEKIGISDDADLYDANDPNNIFNEHPYMEAMDAKETLRSVWPGLRFLSWERAFI